MKRGFRVKGFGVRRRGKGIPAGDEDDDEEEEEELMMGMQRRTASFYDRIRCDPVCFLGNGGSSEKDEKETLGVVVPAGCDFILPK